MTLFWDGSVSQRGHSVAFLLSITLALLAAYVGLELAGRSRSAPDRRSAQLWTLAASLAMGSGVWAMHFVGMSAMVYPFEAGFDFLPTFTSWYVAAIVCWLPLRMGLSPRKPRPVTLWLCGIATAAGIGVMHFIGMAAMPTVPGPIYDWRWVVAALIFAAIGCTLGLAARARACRAAGPIQERLQVQAAILFGSALTGLHFLAQAATTFAPGTICSSHSGIDASALSGSVGVVTLAFLGLMALVSALEKRSQQVAEALNTSLANAHEEIQRARLNDAATELPNRLVFQERLDLALARADASGKSLALIQIEVDEFVRATRDCPPGRVDDILRACANRLLVAAPHFELASGGGHHFLGFITFPGAPNPNAVLRIATRIAEEFRPPILDGLSVRLSVSVGVALHPGAGGAAQLVSNAGVALEAAQSRGGNGYAFFEPGMDRAAHEATKWLDRLRLAAQRGEFELHYQPKIHARTGKIAGVEALLRWRHPEHGFVSPAIFIPLAERFGLINHIGDWVIDEAARQMGAWASEGLRMRVAVNVSPGQLVQPDFADKIAASLQRHAVEPHLLTCEITESGAMQDSEHTMAAFNNIQKIGVQLSIDDFGTGYSSLSHLRKIPLRQLKIDRSFVADLATCADSRAIVSAIVVMAHALRLEVVAEGVETAEQRDILLELGCDKLQGFLFAKPIPAAALTRNMTDIETAARQFQESIFSH